MPCNIFYLFIIILNYCIVVFCIDFIVKLQLIILNNLDQRGNLTIRYV